MDVVGKYLRLRRQLLQPETHEVERPAEYLKRLEADLQRAGDAVQNEQPDAAPFLDTIPWLASLNDGSVAPG